MSIDSTIPVEDVNIAFQDSPAVDAFGRLRVSNPITIFNTKLLGADDAPLFWDEKLESGAGITATTPTADKPYIDLVSSNTTAGLFTRQTFRRFNYQPGKSQLILMTGILELASGTKTGCERRIGAFDDDNGAFFESDAGVFGVTVRTSDSGSPVDTTFTKANWNIDKMDGNGPSGNTVDFTKLQIFVIDWQWLSAGRVRFGLEMNGHIDYVHEVLAANVLTIPWSATPNLPLRYQIVTTIDSGICSMREVCAAVISEGGSEDVGIVHHRGTAGAAVTSAVEDTLYAIIGIRLKTSHLGATVRILKAKIQIQTASEFIEWLVIFNPTVADTFTYGDLSNSAVQFALGVTANTVTGGTHMDGGYAETGGGNSGGAGGADELKTQLELGAAIDGTRDEVVLAFRPIGGVSAADVEGALVWLEQF